MNLKEKNQTAEIFQVSLTTSRISFFLACFICILSIYHPALAQQSTSSCGSLENGYGPFDYRTERHNKLKVVESYHFTSNIENLVKGITGTIGDELDYTLRAAPNHHRALIAMERLAEKLNAQQPPGAKYTVECYFARALQFRPDDNTSRLIYASFLGKKKRDQEAVSQLEFVNATADSPGTHFNIGLIYFDMKKYDNALEQAHKAIALGFPGTELKAQLLGVGKWIEPREKPVGASSEPGG